MSHEIVIVVVLLRKIPTFKGYTKYRKVAQATTSVRFGPRNSSVGRGAVLYYWATYLFRTVSIQDRDKLFMVSQEYPRNAKISPGFPPPQAALRIILSNEGDVVYINIKVQVGTLALLILIICGFVHTLPLALGKLLSREMVGSLNLP